MFIEIESDVFDNLEQITDPFDDRIQAIDALFESMYQGKHIVFSEYRNLAIIPDISLLGQRTKKFVKWILRVFSEIYKCKDSISIYISVSSRYNRISYFEQRIELPLKKVINISETKFLTENESDAKFYQQIAKYIYDKNGMSTFFSIYFENDSYHGSNGKSKIEQISERDSIVLCIADTDMDYPGDSKKSTYKGVSNAVKKARKKIIIDMMKISIREKENLIPAKIYREFYPIGIIRIIADKFSDNEVITNFFDIKDGVKYKKIINCDEKWQMYYGNLIKECEDQNICNKELTEKDIEKYYIFGIGDTICDSVAESIFIGGPELIKKNFTDISNDKIELIDKMRNEMLENVPEFVIINWKQVADTMFSWGCCINKGRYPAQRNW